MKITGSDFINLTDPPVTVTIPRVVVHDFLRAARRLARGQGMKPRHVEAVTVLSALLRPAVGVTDDDCGAKVGDKVTDDNVSDLPIGTVVGWVYDGRPYVATKIAANLWSAPGAHNYIDFDMTDGAPAYIQSLPSANHAP